jgi:ADP-ribosylglycohydrolase.
MRTAAVALPHLDDPDAVAAAARAISNLTHADPRAAVGCLLWSMSVRHAVLTGEFDIRVGLAWLDAAAAWWTARIEEAETSPPERFVENGWVVGAFQAAWSAIVQTPCPLTVCRVLISALLWPEPSASATTPTPSPPSRERSWARAGAHPRCRQSGGECFTAIRG